MSETQSQPLTDLLIDMVVQPTVSTARAGGLCGVALISPNNPEETMADTMATIQRKAGDAAMEAIHESERAWETLRFPGQSSKMMVHPTSERPTDPNAGFVRYEPGAHHPIHRHEFAQIWYILEGTFTIGSKTYRPGTMIFHADPHYEEDLRTETGGLMLFVQYQGPSTGGRPIYDGRFNVAARKALSEEQLDV